MRAAVFAGLLVLAAASPAAAQLLPRYPPGPTRPPTMPCPKLAAFALAGGPPRFADPSLMPRGRPVAAFGPTYLSDGLTVIGIAAPKAMGSLTIVIPRALRAMHALLNGPPTGPGRPFATTLWVMAPWGEAVRERCKERGGLIRGRGPWLITRTRGPIWGRRQ